MPPRKGIIKTGNAGNSSKASKAPQELPTEPTEKPLFPPGSKFPLSLLNERCQKNGWDKANVETYKAKGPDSGFTFSVTLQRTNKKNSQRETVRLQPYPPYESPTALEAKHYGATYALFRFCNNIQLNRVLPPGPREYWQQLEAEKKAAPGHQQWMYNVDPFAAKKEVEDRQEAAAKQKEKIQAVAEGGGRASGSGSTAIDELSSVPEVKMAHELRERVEEAIKQAFSDFPEANDQPADFDSSQVSKQLGHLGFTPPQIRDAIEFLSSPSTLSTNLLQLSSPLEAGIEYLVLNIPECDLPQRFLPSNNSSRSAISSAHSGTEDLKTRWMYDKMKSAGWPAHCVKEIASARPELLHDTQLLVAALDLYLIGRDWKNVTLTNSPNDVLYTLDTDEMEAMGARMNEEDLDELIMPLFSAPVELRVFTSSSQIHANRPSMYLSSAQVPAYVRLHMLSLLLRAVEDDATFMEPGEGFCMAAMRVLEASWADMEDNGRPDMREVMQFLVPAAPTVLRSRPASSQETLEPMPLGRQRPSRGPRGDDRSDSEVKREFEAVCKDEQYKRLLQTREKLPAFAARTDFLEKLDSNRVMVVVGKQVGSSLSSSLYFTDRLVSSVGCGKTTQLPQYVLDSLINSDRGASAKILITQPRRISAISVAARVSAERLDDGSVGYAIRGESKQSKRTKLLFCTTGVVLRRLGSGDTLSDVTHVIIDEVHERSVDSDFLLLEMKDLLKRHKTLKVILMSATINHETFVRYFGGCPLLTIPGRTYPVTDIYIEDVLPRLGYRANGRMPGKKQMSDPDSAFVKQLQQQGYDDTTISSIQSIGSSDRTDYQLIAAVVDHIMKTSDKGGILIFLQGVQEIRQCIDNIRSVVSDGSADIFPLHANLSSSEQKRVFVSTSKWKIVVSTNVAETSITIDDIIYVIDSGKVKESQYEAESGLCRLVETWTTKAAAGQRRGRAGRTQPGKCYKLYTRSREASLVNFPVPEILRVPLENVLLTIKVIRESEDPTVYLSQAIDPPKTSAMSIGWSILQELGAVDPQGSLTALGRHISRIPVDLRLGKMLVLGTIFRCLSPVLTIAALLSSKPLFISPMEKRDEASSARMKFVSGESDLLTDLNAYNACMDLSGRGKSSSALKAFCENNFISSATVREISTLRSDFLSALSERGLVPLSASSTSPIMNLTSENINLLKSVILGGLWPRVCRVHLPKSAIKFDKVSAGTVRRENTAKEYKMFDIRDGRVFLHPASVLFHSASWRSPFLVYFNKHKTTKVFLRDATQVPLYALLLFGGQVTVNHVKGGLTVSSGSGEHFIQLKAWPRIGILVNHLKRLLDAQLQRCIEEGSLADEGGEKEGSVVGAMLALLTHDGATHTFE